VTVPAEAPPIPPLYSYDLDVQLNQYLACTLAQARPGWAAKAGLDDDSIPSIVPRFGVAEHSAWLGMDVRLQQETCLPIPLLDSPDDLEKLQPKEGSRWYGYMRRGYDYLRSRKDGTFLLAVRGTMSPMDLANAVRGDALFEDFLLRPEFVHCLMRRMTEALRWYYPRLRSWADEVEDGWLTAFYGGWMGPGFIGHLSNDAAMLCSPAIYDEFGYPYERQMLAGYPHVLYHVHNERMHYVPVLSRLPGLSLIEVTQDPRTPPELQDLDRILAATGSANLMLHAASDHVRLRIEDLKQRNIFLDVGCKDREDAEDIVAFVRRHSRPLQ
jgi:hypothetical protein